MALNLKQLEHPKYLLKSLKVREDLIPRLEDALRKSKVRYRIPQQVLFSNALEIVIEDLESQLEKDAA